MSEELEIRPATDADLDAIHKLETVAFPIPWRREFFDSELHADSRLNLVAIRGGHIIGYVFAMWIFDEMHVNKIAVTPAEHRKGIANALMDRCFAFAAEHEVRSMSLEVRESNHGAQEFYRRLEFIPLYLRPRYYPDGESAVVMTRVLEPS